MLISDMTFDTNGYNYHIIVDSIEEGLRSGYLHSIMLLWMDVDRMYGRL